VLRNPTVFVLGAGASVPYGYPTGAELVNELLKPVNDDDLLLRFDFYKFQNALRKSQAESIDSFLEHWPEYADAGRFAIARALIKRENEQRLLSGKTRRGQTVDHWYRYLFNRIVEGVKTWRELCDVPISFVTFNYDRSLEHFLYTAIASFFSVKRHIQVGKVFSKWDIVHLHGHLGPLHWQGAGSIKPRSYSSSANYAQILNASKCIATLHNVDARSGDFWRAKILLCAERIYVLGFGFHPVNMERLDLATTARAHPVRCTSVGLTPEEKEVLKGRYPGLAFQVDNRSITDFLRNDTEFLRDIHGVG
jgi:hypothetical protein